MSDFTVAVPWKDAQGQGLEGVVEVHRSELPGQEAKVIDLVAIVSQKINRETPNKTGSQNVQSLLLYGSPVQEDRLLESLIPEFTTNVPRLVATTRHEKDGKFNTLAGTFNTLVSKIIQFARPSHDVNKTGMKEAKCQHQQRVDFASKIAGNRPLSKMKEEKLVTLALREAEKSVDVAPKQSRDGSPPPSVFTVVSDVLIPSQSELLRSAPKWRTVSKGLNIIGKCENRECDAFGDFVIHPAKFGSFNFIKDGTVPCPMCHTGVKPVACSIYDCVWKFKGMRSCDNCFIISRWRDAKNASVGHSIRPYQTFKWISLLIMAKPREKSAAAKLLGPITTFGGAKDGMCFTCWSTLGSTARQSIFAAPCGHSFHRVCIDKWSKWSSSPTGLPSCPACL